MIPPVRPWRVAKAGFNAKPGNSALPVNLPDGQAASGNGLLTDLKLNWKSMQTTDIMGKKRWLALVSAFAAIALTACGGGDGDESSPPPEPEPLALPVAKDGRVTLLAGSLSAECGVVNVGAITVHQGALWLADKDCDNGARIQSLNVDTGEVTPRLVIPRDTQAFQYPTGIGWDSKGNLYVVDGYSPIARWGDISFGLPSAMEGKAAGIWKVSGTDMRVFAGVLHTNVRDGVGDQAGFHLPNGLAVDAQDNLYTQDWRVLRTITPGAQVSSAEQSVGPPVGPPVADASGQVYAARVGQQNGVTSHYLAAVGTDTPFATLPTRPDVTVFDKAGNLYVASLPLSPSSSEFGMVYRRRAGSENFEPVITQVQYLTGAAVDAQGDLYLHQRHAIVKVTFD